MSEDAATAAADLERELDETYRSFTELTNELAAANEALVRNNAELDEFTYIASHDLQEPLRKLAAFSDLLRRDLGDGLSGQVASHLEHITDAATRMRALVQGLLTFSRAGRTAMEADSIPLDECADEAIDLLALRIEETAATITRDTLPEVRGDQTMLTLLYQNLISNALKFTNGRAPVVRLTAERHNGRCVLGVRDSGIGIKPEYAEQIFSPFTRLHARGEYEGTGIGLALCRKTVERHGGRIWVESEEGRGAHFKFTIDEGGNETP